jgi:hypothetical protein
MKRSIIIFPVLIVILSLSGCIESKRPPDTSSIELEPIEIKRYEQALFAIDPGNIIAGLDTIYYDFSFFLGDNYQDTQNIIRLQNFLTDPMIRNLKTEVDQVYPELEFLEQGLTNAWKYCKYYFPGIKAPDVYSYISGLYYEAPVEYIDSVMIISLDLYLGQDFDPYRAIGLPNYKTRRMNADHLLPDCMKQAGISLLPGDLPQRTLLDHMVFHGKLLYFLDLVLPGYPDSLKIGYQAIGMTWCEENEAKIWSLFLEKELLFSTDPFAINKFIQDGPFTSGLPEDSPSMIGRWTGWRIVRAYMKRQPDMQVADLFSISNSQEILSQSRYKPSL